MASDFKLLQPGLGGVNLEDISQPKCFYILDKLRAECEIPVWHDDQQKSIVAMSFCEPRSWTRVLSS